MSMELMVKAMKTKVGNPLRKLVLIKLADNANDLGECWPSYQHIADQCEIDRSTVRKHIKNLEGQGFLRIENRLGPKGNSSNLYQLTFSGVGQGSTPVGHTPTPVGQESTGGVGPESTRTSHSLEPVNEPLGAGAPAASRARAKFDPLTAKPSNVSAEAWAEWCEYRGEIKKKLTPLMCKQQGKDLAGHVDPDAVIRLSIGKGWIGLFPDKIAAAAPSRHHGFAERDYIGDMTQREDGSYAF